VVNSHPVQQQKAGEHGNRMAIKISYGTSEEGWLGYHDFISRLIDEHKAGRVCEIGGGANPLLDITLVEKKGISYSVMDISRTELDKAPSGYDKIVADAGSAAFAVNRQFDLVFSRMLIEHVRDAEQFHRNVHSLLAPGGLAVHFFPTLFTTPYLVNYLVPDRLSRMLWRGFAKRDEYQNAKFPAYYRWCRGPVQGQIDKFIRIGFDVLEYRGFFGHHGYYKKIWFLKKLHDAKTRYLLKRPNPSFTSYAYVVLRKA
jgi:2-polyprenyl-3-methyl-5-hydroxy-6-metoxy-1,4-benzoquinol methylase